MSVKEVSVKGVLVNGVLVRGVSNERSVRELEFW
jgi:hypothetical protein